MGEEVVAALANCMQGLFVETATGPALDRVVFDRYGLRRQGANPASVDITLSRPVPGAATPGTYAQGSRVQTAAGFQFATDDDAVFGDFDTSASVSATALVAGPTGNVSAGTVTQFADSPFDPNLEVVNALGAAGGTFAETDDEFRGRARDFFPTVRRGTLGAIEFGARSVPGVAVASAYELTNPCDGNPVPACAVSLIVADADGGFSSKMLLDVRDNLIDFRAAGIPVIVSGGVVAEQTVTWDIGFDAGVNTVRVAEEVRAVTVAVSQFLAPGQTLLRSALIAGARAVPGAVVNDGSLVTPVGDVVPTLDTELIRIRSEGVTFV